jgi:hypothetical protein
MWLITWEGTTNDITDENKIAGVLASRCSDSYVEKLLDFLYQRTILDVHDMAYYANKRKDREKRFKKIGAYPGHIFWGENPFLFARIVKEFKADSDNENNQEVISWVEHAVIGNDIENGFKLKELAPEKRKKLIRKRYQPIVNEPENA